MIGTDKITRIRNSVFDENTYIYTLTENKCLVIDPGFDTEKITTTLSELSLTPLAVLCTHGHFDHIAGAKHLQTVYACPVYLHAADLKIMKQSNFFLKVFNTDLTIEVPIPDVLINEETAFVFNNEVVTFIPAPGHTPGGCLIQLGSSYFTGDTIYKNKIDHYNLPGLNKPILIETVSRLWNTIPDSAVLYPGHGEADEFKNIKANNVELRKFIGVA